MKVSIIVPVYNVEEKINRCVTSLLNQTYHDIEIILVDDKSPDNCPQKCDIFASKFPAIRVIHKSKNEGLGMARNTGLFDSKGEYLIFVDSDDYIEANTVELALNQICKENADVCYYSCSKLNANGGFIKEKTIFPNTLGKTQIMKELFPKCFGGSQRTKDSYSIGSSCMAMYRKKFLMEKGISFLSEREVLSEDVLFNANICINANCITFISENLYVYCENEESLTHSYREDRFRAAENLYSIMINFINVHYKSKDAVLRAQDTLISNTIVCLKQEMVFKRYTKKQKIEHIRVIEESIILQNVLKKYPLSELSIFKRMLFKFIKKKMTIPVFLLVKAKTIMKE